MYITATADDNSFAIETCLTNSPFHRNYRSTEEIRTQLLIDCAVKQTCFKVNRLDEARVTKLTVSQTMDILVKIEPGLEY